MEHQELFIPGDASQDKMTQLCTGQYQVHCEQSIQYSYREAVSSAGPEHSFWWQEVLITPSQSRWTVDRVNQVQVDREENSQLYPLLMGQ